MIRGLQILAIALALIACITAIAAYRMQGASLTAKRSIRASLLISTAIIVGVAPALFFPSVTWLRMTGSVVSMAITIVAFVVIRRKAPPTTLAG